MTDVIEEHSVLRVVDPELAATLRRMLEEGQEEDFQSVKITFDGVAERRSREGGVLASVR